MVMIFWVTLEVMCWPHACRAVSAVPRISRHIDIYEYHLVTGYLQRRVSRVWGLHLEIQERAGVGGSTK